MFVLSGYFFAVSLWQLVKDFFIILTKRLHFWALLYLVSEQAKNLVGYRFLAVRVEINLDPIGCLADTLHKVGLFGFRRCGSGFICIHIDFLSALFAL